jgi:hypothetical protein
MALQFQYQNFHESKTQVISLFIFFHDKSQSKQIWHLLIHNHEIFTLLLFNNHELFMDAASDTLWLKTNQKKEFN